MVFPDSDRVPRVPPYSGTHSPLFWISPTGLSPAMAQFSKQCSTIHRSQLYVRPTTPQEPKLLWFGLFPFRSPLLRESHLISLPRGTEMFHFPPFASLSRYWCFTPVGFPIQKSPDQSSFSSSPKLIAAIPRLSSPLIAKASSVCS